MKNKPNLVLTEKDLLAGIKNPNRNFSKKLKADLITVLEYMKENAKVLKIDLGWYKVKRGCGTYRCICGWWAYWLGIPIRKDGDEDLTNRFKNVFHDGGLWQGFEFDEAFSYMSSYSTMFFGDRCSGSVTKRLALAKTLKVA